MSWECYGWSCRLFVVSKDAFGSAVTVEFGSRECLRACVLNWTRIWGYEKWKTAAKQKILEVINCSCYWLERGSWKCKHWSKAGEVVGRRPARGFCLSRGPRWVLPKTKSRSTTLTLPVAPDRPSPNPCRRINQHGYRTEGLPKPSSGTEKIAS